MSFPLYRRPGGVLFLDDDPDYLEMLGEVMPPGWSVQLFLRPIACIDLLKQEIAQRENDAWRQQEIIHRWREGALLIPQILRYWQVDGAARFRLVQVAVVDYAMPAMSGLRVLGELQDWPGSRILLTGRADEQLAVSAFNRGLINQFLPKQSADLRTCLTRAIEDLRHQPDQRHQQIWCATLSPDQLALLADPVIFQALHNLTQQQGWTEHVVIGAPFGMLALNARGQASWLQLEPAANLGELAEMAVSQGWDARVVQDIRSGSWLIDLELQLALGVGHQPGPCEAFVVNGEAGRLHAAIFAIGEAFSPGLSTSYAHFLANHGERRLSQG
ncbi:response regulator [Polaromonas sp. CG_9.11]|uniref:response regulator n=1 Tax=Polaromonas sp. CG_9.11 TaxID=2787730 RepID=UPI0018CA8B3C|nr:response regulator [Polaromonas sp. CG_9.11]MBG6074660.1 CheY-like chemotaxis protein [Polaromonas sp. CG_9.11]